MQGVFLEGVMIGRAAYNDPWGCLGDADRVLFGAANNAASSRRQVCGASVCSRERVGQGAGAGRSDLLHPDKHQV